MSQPSPRPDVAAPGAEGPALRPDGLPTSLRLRKKVRTRLAIQEHALRLFRDQGYERTTVEQIAEAAEVSPSTFFRYFPTKEDVVLYDAVDPVLIDAFRAQPPELSVLAAMRAAVVEVWGRMSPREIGEQQMRGRLVYEVPELQSAWITDLLRTSRLMAGLAAERLGRAPDDFEVRVYTGAVMGTMMAAMLPLLEGDDPDGFLRDMDRALALLEHGFPF